MSALELLTQPLEYEFMLRALVTTVAAASVCARNPVALFVPCHRVLRSDGSMGGFAWGEAIKRDLLRREARSAA